jgi:hypothetical protein
MRNSSRPPRFLQVMQVNVGKGGAAHETALNLAYEEGIDLILVQEPWIHSNLDRRIPKKHPAYSCFTPTEKWDKRPRVLTYVRKHPQIRAYIVSEPWTANRDILLLCVWAWGLQLHIANTYNAPHGCTDPGQGVKHLLSWTPHHCPCSSPATSIWSIQPGNLGPP